MKKPQYEDFQIPKPAPEDYGVSLIEYHKAKATKEKKSNWIKREAVPELCASFFICFLIGLLLSVLGANQSFCGLIISVGPFIILIIWFIILPFIDGLRFDKNVNYIEDTITRNIRMYEKELVYYKEAPIRYKEALASYNQTLESHWKSIRGTQLENELANLYRKVGYIVQQTKATGDKGIDLKIKKDGKITIVQCKGYKKPTGVGVVRDLYGTMMDSGADLAILVCPAGFTKGVVDFVCGKQIQLISARELIVMAEDAEQRASSQMQEKNELLGHCV